jgi:hypothetical protein
MNLGTEGLRKIPTLNEFIEVVNDSEHDHIMMIEDQSKDLKIREHTCGGCRAKICQDASNAYSQYSNGGLPSRQRVQAPICQSTKTLLNMRNSGSNIQ